MTNLITNSLAPWNGPKIERWLDHNKVPVVAVACLSVALFVVIVSKSLIVYIYIYNV